MNSSANNNAPYVASPTLLYAIGCEDKKLLDNISYVIFEHDKLPTLFKFNSVDSSKDKAPFYADVHQDRSSAINDTVVVSLVLDSNKLQKDFKVSTSTKLPEKRGQQVPIRIYSHAPLIQELHKYVLAVDVLMQAPVTTMQQAKAYATKFNLPLRYFESRFDMILGTEFIHQTKPEKTPSEKINPLEDYYKQLKQLNAFLRALKDYRTNIQTHDTVQSYIMREAKIPEHKVKSWLLGDTLVGILEPLKEMSDSTIAAQKQDLENFCRYNGISSFQGLTQYIDKRVVKTQKFINSKKKFEPGED